MKNYLKVAYLEIGWDIFYKLIGIVCYGMGWIGWDCKVYVQVIESGMRKYETGSDEKHDMNIWKFW